MSVTVAIALTSAAGVIILLAAGAILAFASWEEGRHGEDE